VGLILELKRSIGMSEEVRVGKEIVIGNRTIWPVVKISVFWAFEKRIHAVQVAPLAFLIIEKDAEYALSIDGTQMTIEAILEMAPSLRDILVKRRESCSERGCRIVVS
jgi:uncharacterized spore protein YtfJ